MGALFYLSGILIVLALKMLLWGIKKKSRNEIIVGSVVLTISTAYIVYFF
jgi:hypothetical protein